MTLSTGGCMQGLGMTGAAGTAAMIDSPSTFICNARVWTFIYRRPVSRRVAGCAIQAKHTGMEDRDHYDSLNRRLISQQIDPLNDIARKPATA